MAEHLVAQVRFHLGGRAEDGDAPQKAAEYNGQDDGHHGHTDSVQHEIHIKRDLHAIFQDIALVQAVDDQLIDFWDFQLKIVHREQGEQSCQQGQRILSIVDVDVFSEYQMNSPFSLTPCRKESGRGGQISLIVAQTFVSCKKKVANKRNIFAKLYNLHGKRKSAGPLDKYYLL